MGWFDSREPLGKGNLLVTASSFLFCPANPVQRQSGGHSRHPRWCHPSQTLARVQRAQHAGLPCKWQSLSLCLFMLQDDPWGLNWITLFLQVSICLPPLKTMKNVVDRMKNLSNFLVESPPNISNLKFDHHPSDSMCVCVCERDYRGQPERRNEPEDRDRSGFCHHSLQRPGKTSVG